MQAGVGLLVSDVMPIYMIIPRYSHNYAQFCQLLNSNLFTHHKILMLLREATSETYGPRVFFLIYLLGSTFPLHFYSDLLNQKIQKYFAALYFIYDLFIQSITTLSRPHAVSGAVTRKGLTTPLTRGLRGVVICMQGLFTLCCLVLLLVR